MSHFIQFQNFSVIYILTFLCLISFNARHKGGKPLLNYSKNIPANGFDNKPQKYKFTSLSSSGKYETFLYHLPDKPKDDSPQSDYINNSPKIKIPKVNFGTMPNKYTSYKFENMTFREFLKVTNVGMEYPSLNAAEKYTLLKGLTHFVTKEPVEPIDNTCGKETYISMNCAKYSSVFNGERTKEEQNRIKIAHLIQFGFDSDVLEILLNEIYDEVDKFFIIESQETHFLQTPKELVWPILAKQKRFEKFLDKIVYIVLTQKIIRDFEKFYPRTDSVEDIWIGEKVQERFRWEAFKQWNEFHNNYFSNDDIIGFGDCDEIPSFQNLRLLKKCQMKGTTDIGIWFTFGQINKYFVSDYPVKNHSNTLGDPTYFILREAKAKAKLDLLPTRNRGNSPFYLLGGLHLSRYRYLPSLLMKDLTQTEAENGNTFYSIFSNGLSTNEPMHSMALKLYKGHEDSRTEKGKYRDLKQEALNTLPYLMPWFLECNLDRYPSFQKNPKPDPRVEP
ncbi:putative beta-1,4-mannosyl-glycoprotein beta-1,4-N-acetylglucosaminyltransferase [Tritrichomonas foetus]|uniref:Beta-1,4-mannosyl-glycoprotein beta-1,4-N-acetylglucosaminyltransferase n=1 Tax=Tritrichomonas foetus TaxID=1144522 RepID=A0A1J4JCE0_9EUKA|nr:putative beta-1,4-mannosyl-glycoprotein beta-1,4-N-acetylglucosaminyltransferase [Tritrichomonas foetus]|eukprot:OHS95077.1 putative beta-1,4-mannosyl-glycoprotein beta-1,4-N-acetylglucosaminyltransferase [Tritrichomonas foetus]